MLFGAAITGMSVNGRICIFGEVLFDHFPGGERVLGGAPFNVAWHLQAFGQHPRFISRVGPDAEGGAVRAAMEGWGMELGGLQTDPALPTGRVSVALADGEPSYDIVHPVAYDAIAPADAGNSCRLLYHGSLALRENASRLALERLRGAGPATVFMDVNLRPPWWQREQVLAWVAAADWVKLNRDELDELAGSGDEAEARFLEAHGLQGLVLTEGSRGATLLTAAGERQAVKPRGGQVVVDTVGAGDAFSAVMIVGLAQSWPHRVSLRRAQDFASAVVGLRGATVGDAGFYRRFLESWGPAGPGSG
jgi:fructokinase